MAEHLLRAEIEPSSFVEGQPVTVKVFHSLANVQPGNPSPLDLNVRLHFDGEELEAQGQGVNANIITAFFTGLPTEETVEDGNSETNQQFTWEFASSSILFGGSIPAAETELFSVTLNPTEAFDGSSIVLEGDGTFDVTGDTVDLGSSGNSTEDTPPVVENPIADVTAEQDAADRVIDLSDTFFDADGDEIALAVKTNSNEDLVTPSLDGDSLTLDFLEGQSGTAEITIEATANGAMVEDTFMVTVNEVTPENTPPTVANPLGNIPTPATEDSEFSFVVPDDTFADADAGDRLSYSATLEDGSDLPTWLTFAADTKTFSGTPDNSNVGSLEIKVTATDNNGATVSDDFSLTVENVDDPPFVANEIANVTVDEDADDSVIDLSDVFSDVDNDNDAITKTISTNSNEDLVTATIDGDNLTLDYLENQSGTAEITVAGESNGQTVTDSFTVTVNPVDDAPIVQNAIADVNADQDAADETIDLSNVFSDADGDEITLAVKTNTNEDLVTPILDGDSLTLDFLEGQSGTADITIEATANGVMVEDTFMVTVNEVIIDPPPVVANEIADVTVDQDADDATIDLSNVFFDADGDEITLAVKTNSNETLVTPNLEGDSLTLDFLDGQSGTAEITIEAAANGVMVEDTFMVTVLPTEPPIVVNEIADVTVEEDTEFSLTIPEDTFADADEGDSLTYSASLEDDSQLPDWLSFDATTKTFNGTPDDSDVGTLAIQVTATDNSGDMTSDIFTLTIENVDDPPVVSNEIADVTVDEDAEDTVIDLSNVFSDLDHDDTTIVKGVPFNSKSTLVTTNVVGNNLTLDYQENQFGTAEITVRGRSNGQIVEDVFSVTVNPVDDAPIVQNPVADLSVEENADNSLIDLSDVFTDLDNDDSAIIKTILTNSNQDLVNASIDGENLILDYQENQFGTAEITIQAESNGQVVSDRLNVTVEEVASSPEYLVGSQEADEFNGTNGNDSLFGGSGDDSLLGGEGDDFLIGLTDNDLIEGGQGNDYLVGYDGDDFILGNEGDDILLGNQDNDNLDGGAGNDLLSGGAGDDLLSGGMGNDTLWGKEGADIFALEPGQEQDIISDFTDGTDFIALGSGMSFDDLTVVGDDDAQIIDSEDRTLAVLSGINASGISTDDFIAS